MDGETKRLTLFPEQTFFVRTGNTQVGVHGERSPPGVLFRAAIAEKTQEFEECFSGQRVLLDLASQPCLWRWWRLLLCWMLRKGTFVLGRGTSGKRTERRTSRASRRGGKPRRAEAVGKDRARDHGASASASQVNARVRAFRGGRCAGDRRGRRRR